MTRSPHLCIMLAAAGLQNAAAELERADDSREELAAIRCAIAMIDGFQLALRRHAPTLLRRGDGSAAFEAGQLRGLEEDLIKRRDELLARGDTCAPCADSECAVHPSSMWGQP